MTAITAIFAALAALTPTWDSDTPVTIVVWDGAVAGRIKNTLPSASVPIRILSTTGDAEGREFAFIAMGKTSKITWVIEDLLLAKSVSEGDNIKGMSHHLVAYCNSYITKLRDVRALTSQSHVVALDLKPGNYEWGGAQYFGVKALVTVDEFHGGA